MSKALSVIIPIFRDWTRLALCLRALEEQTLAQEEFEIIIANNEPDGRCPLDRLPVNARLVHEPRPGSYVARNAALQVAQGDCFAFTDSDCIPETGWLEHGKSLVDANPDSRVTGPIAIFREPDASHLAYVYDFHTALNQLRYIERGYCATANLFVTRETFDKVGPFDPGLFSGGDAEWGRRALALGVPLIHDDGVVVRHPARRSVSEVLRRKRRFAGAEARKHQQATYRYVLGRLKPPPPFKSTGRQRHPGRRRISRVDGIILFVLQWLVMLNEAFEFLLVRMGVKQPNRT